MWDSCRQFSSLLMASAVDCLFIRGALVLVGYMYMNCFLSQVAIKAETHISQSCFTYIVLWNVSCVLLETRVKDGGGEAKYRRSTFSLNCTGKPPSGAVCLGSITCGNPILSYWKIFVRWCCSGRCCPIRAKGVSLVSSAVLQLVTYCSMLCEICSWQCYQHFEPMRSFQVLKPGYWSQAKLYVYLLENFCQLFVFTLW
jgi:hypothetical protein